MLTVCNDDGTLCISEGDLLRISDPNPVDEWGTKAHKVTIEEIEPRFGERPARIFFHYVDEGWGDNLSDDEFFEYDIEILMRGHFKLTLTALEFDFVEELFSMMRTHSFFGKALDTSSMNTVQGISAKIALERAPKDSK